MADFTEVETGKSLRHGKHVERPQLAQALAVCRKRKATLVIAKLDRLARSVHFVSGLMESGVPFVACDSPDDEPFIIHMKAAFAEEEARKISQRTKAALAAAKARGVVPGGYRGAPPPDAAARAGGLATLRRNAREAAGDVADATAEIRAAGITSANGIAGELNRRGFTTARAAGKRCRCSGCLPCSGEGRAGRTSADAARFAPGGVSAPRSSDTPVCCR